MLDPRAPRHKASAQARRLLSAGPAKAGCVGLQLGDVDPFARSTRAPESLHSGSNSAKNNAEGAGGGRAGACFDAVDVPQKGPPLLWIALWIPRKPTMGGALAHASPLSESQPCQLRSSPQSSRDVLIGFWLSGSYPPAAAAFED